MRTPRTLALDIASQCNLRCLYCFHSHSPASVSHELSTDEWLQFFEELGNCAVMSVLLQGGEPFVRPDLPTLLHGITSNHMRFAILSNGTLIDDEIAASIASTGRCECVRVSVDGSSPYTHDAFRGNGSFNAAIQGIRVLQRHGVNVTTRVTIHRRNVHDLENTARLLLEDLEVANLDASSAAYLGSCRQNAEEVILTTQERQVAMETLTRLSGKYPGRISASAGPLDEAKRWRRMEEARSQKALPFAKGGFLTGCGCISNNLAVRADGVMVPCTLLPHIELGRVNRDSLMNIWQDAPELRRLRKRCTIPLAEFDLCAECHYIPYCTGNCAGPAYAITGEVDHPSPAVCLKAFLEDGGEVV